MSAGGWAGGPPDDTFRAEGLAMLAAVLADLQQVPGANVIALAEKACCRRLGRGLPLRVIAGEETASFEELARSADFALVIAPEFDGILEDRCRRAQAAGARLLGPSPEAVRLAGDKWSLGLFLAKRGIPTPPCHRLAPASLKGLMEADAPPARPLPPLPLVIKPRHGAGSRATIRVNEPGQLAGALSLALSECGTDELLAQPFAAGRPVSNAFLLGAGQVVVLPPAAQHLSPDGRFRYLGGRLPLPLRLARRARDLATRAVQAVPGLEGYVGVDLVLGTAPDGSQDQVIEINPRLTTSYVGLRRMVQTNLAAALLRVVRGEPAGHLSCRPGTVVFTADGACRNRSARTPK